MTKPFDPTKNNGHCQTRDGRKARILCTDGKRQEGYEILALITEVGGFDREHWYMPDGRWNTNWPVSHYDLVNIPEKRKYWVVTFSTADGLANSIHYNNREQAVSFAHDIRRQGRFIATHEGEYDVE